MKNNRPFPLRINKDAYDILKREADKQERSVNWLLNHILCKEAERLNEIWASRATASNETAKRCS